MNNMEARKTKVLLIEDAPGGQFELKDVMSKAKGIDTSLDISMELADRMDNGLELLDKGDVDLVLLDVSNGNGGPDASSNLQKIVRLKECQSGVPVVMVGDRDQNAMASAAVRNGALDFLVKENIDGRALMQAIDRKSVV